jgi:hypothetical protein
MTIDLSHRQFGHTVLMAAWHLTTASIVRKSSFEKLRCEELVVITAIMEQICFIFFRGISRKTLRVSTATTLLAGQSPAATADLSSRLPI